MRNKIVNKTRRIMNRSGKMACEICKNHELLITHHILGRDIPNANHSSNLAYICERDHRLVHEGLIIIEGRFYTTDGLQLFWHLKNQKSFSGQDAKPYIIP